MLQSKDIQSIEELKKYFACSTKMVDYLVNLLSFFEFKKGLFGVKTTTNTRSHADFYVLLHILKILIQSAKR